MSIIGSPTGAHRFGLALDGLGRAVAAQIVRRLMTAAMIMLVWQRIRRVEKDIAGLLARFAAGSLRVVAVPRVRRGGGPSDGPCVGAARPGAERLPMGFGWLLPRMPWEAACFAGQIRSVLAEPEVVALLRISPQARRVLRPLCRMLAIKASVLGDVAERQTVVNGSAGVAAQVRARAARAPAVPERVPLPRGVLTAARRQGFGKR